MDKIFNKNDYRLTNEKVKIIIDTDPGVDDSVCIVYAMNDENIEVKLMTTVVGNIPVNKCTRNLLHVLELFNFNVPVAEGACCALKRVSPTAEHIHKKEGMGRYIPSEPNSLSPLPICAVDAMYKVISEGDGDIIPVMLGPLTNIAQLLISHPEIKEKIPQIVIMGGAPYGNPNYPAHVSFNLSSDPEALQVVLDSGIPILMCPSHIGRYKAHLDAEFVENLKNVGEVGKFFHTLYDGYWEPTAPTKRVTTNDSCALFALVYPKIFDIKRVNVSVNVTDAPGRTQIDFVPDGKIRFIDDLDRDAFIKLITTELEDLRNVKLNRK